MGNRKIAVVTGVAGQDGSILSEFLLSKNYEVYGFIRRASIPRLDNLKDIIDNEDFHLIETDVTDPSSINNLVSTIKPDEYYHLAAQSHVKTSFDQPTTTFNINVLGTLNALEAIKNYSKNTKFYNASTSEQFGQNYREVTQSINFDGLIKKIKIQDELVPFAPRSPYGVSKLAAHEIVKVYRESYNLHASSGILFNHEGKRRGHNFVTRKITRWLGWFANRFDLELSNLDVLDTIAPLLQDNEKLRLGNLSAVRDWGHANDSIYAMYLMLQQDNPDDYVIATGEGHTIEEFLLEAFKLVNPDLDYRDFVVIDPSLYRPSEVDYLCGNASKAYKKLGWKPKTSFKELVKEMVTNDIEAYSG